MATAENRALLRSPFFAYFKTSYNFTPQCILGDFDSISDKRVLAEYASEIVQKFSCDKDWTDTEIAIENAYKKAAHENSVPYITLIGGDGGRIRDCGPACGA